MDAYEHIEYAVADRIATVTLNRPQARNGYTVRMADELADAFDRADADDGVRVVVLTGTGKDFTVGADLSSGGLDMEAIQSESWDEPAGRCSMRIFAMNKPVIAALRGAAVGAGSTIILPADYRLASTDSRFGFVFSRRGLYPEGASTWFLPRIVGLGRAMDWMVSGRVFGADEALAAGLVHSLHEPDEVLDRAYELARELIVNTAPVSVAVIRQMLYRMSPLESPFPVQRLDSRLIASCVTSPDAMEGVLSFLQRRDPQWSGTPSKDLPDHLPWRSAD
ncbi:MAG TPA: enoyl-CoA hydratase-related protein [Actinophytocola sp.]|nr:enoyl-CoA hydratase-related protein [Actinophytocola sp.]